MSSKRLHTLLVGVVCLLLIGMVAGAYGINSIMSKEAAKLTSLKSRNKALEQEQLSLIKAKIDVQKYAELEGIAHTVVPNDKKPAEAVRQIVSIANRNGIVLQSVTLPASTLGNSVKPSANGTVPSKVPEANPNTVSLSQLQPVKNISGVYQFTIIVASDTKQPVRYDSFISFLKELEQNRRTAQVSNITLQPSTKDLNYLSFTLTINSYIKPEKAK